MTPHPPKKTLARILSFAGKAIAGLLVFVLGVVGALLVSLDLPVVRRFAVKELNGILGTQFKGKITIDRLAHLSIFGVGGVDATITAADGSTVVTEKGFDAHISPFRVVRSVIFGKGDYWIGVDTASIDAVDVNLDAQPDGSLKLVGAFDPKEPSPPATKPSRGMTIDLARITVRHVSAHGMIPGVPTIDADVDALAASFLSTSTVTKVDVKHLSLMARGLPQGVTVNTDVEGHLTMPSPSGGSMAVGGAAHGNVGEIPLTASMSLDGDALDGVLDVPEVAAERVRATVEGAPVYSGVSLHAEAHGALENLKVALGAHLGEGTLAVDGLVHAKGAIGGDATVTASHIDARTFAKDAPATDVGFRLKAKGEDAATGPVAEASLVIPEGTAAGQRVPPATLKLSVVGHPSKDASPQTFVGHVEGVISEPGAPVALTADGTFHDGVGGVTFGVKADAPHLSEVTRLGGVGSGSAELSLSGHAAFGATTSFDAELTALAQSFTRPDAHVESVHIAAKAHGSPAKPEIQALVVATGVAAAGYKLSRAEVEIAGTPEKGRVALSATGDGSPDLKVTADVAVGSAVTVTSLSLGLKRQKEAVTVAAESLALDGGTIAGKGILVTGAGDPLRASFHAAPGALSLTAVTKGLDLSKIAFVAGLDKKNGGKLALDVDVDAHRDHGKGRVAIDLTDGEWSTFHGMEAHVGMELDGRHLTGQLRAALADVGSVDLSDVDVHVGGQGPLAATAWKHAWGKMTLAGNIDMARAAVLSPPPPSMHVADIAGRVTVTGHIERDSLSDTTPEIHLSIATEGLAATGESIKPVRRPGGPLMVGPATWNLQGVDARVDLAIDGADSAGELALRVVDKVGVLVGVDCKTDPLPFKDLFHGEEDIATRLEELPFSLLVDIPKRELGSLPLLIRPDGLRGGLAATLWTKGTIEQPVIHLALTTDKIVARVAPDAPMDGALDAYYDGSNARLTVDVKSPTAQVLSGEANVHARATDILLAKGLPPVWGGDVKATLSRFPLGAIGALSDDQVQGLVSGNLALTGLHEDATASLSLTLDQLQLGKAKFSKASVSGVLNGKGLNGKLKLDGGGSSLEADASMGMKWGSALVPSPDGTGLQAKVTAKHFPAAAGAPFASSALSELAGWVDADASLALVPNTKPKMSGSIALSDGLIQVPAIGEEFHAVKAKVTLNEQGVVTLSDVEARGLSGKLTASGSARLDGTTLVGADVALDIRKADAIPLDIQGSNLGTAYGNVTVKAAGAPDGKSLTIAVNVPHFRVDLPSGSLPRSPQALGDAPGVHMGAYTSPDRFLVLAVDGSPLALVAKRNTALPSELSAGGVAPVLVTPTSDQASVDEKEPSSTAIEAKIHLAEVEVTRGQQMDINLDGDLTAKVSAATTVRGEIHLKSGKLNVQSKEFEIEKGTISFVGDDPSNPEVTVTAAWPAPDGTKVLANYVGPVKTGKVSLSSEPPRPKNEIVQLILFGTADGSEATPYASKSPSTGTQAGTTVGGLATDGLSKGLDQLTGMNVTTKVDTSDSSNPRADLELQLAKDISIQLAYVIVQPPPGDNPDLVYATIDWRFVRNWSLETTFGDAGSTFANMVWQYRY